MKGSHILLNKALESIGGEKEFLRKSEQYGKSLAYFKSNREKLLRDYDEQWIAIYNSEVIAHGGKWESVIRAVEEAKLPDDEVLFEYLSNEKTILLL
jgi:ribosomal protein L20